MQKELARLWDRAFLFFIYSTLKRVCVIIGVKNKDPKCTTKEKLQEQILEVAKVEMQGKSKALNFAGSGEPFIQTNLTGNSVSTADRLRVQQWKEKGALCLASASILLVKHHIQGQGWKGTGA